MKPIKVALVVAPCFAALLAFSSSASAEIVCNQGGDCWHTKGPYEPKPEFKVIVHPDDWKWKESEKYRWREHEGRGYWDGDNWRDF